MDRDTIDIIASFDQRLKRVDRAPKRGGVPDPPRRTAARRFAAAAVTILLATVLPMVALVRLSSWFYLRLGYSTWGALAAAIATGW